MFQRWRESLEYRLNFTQISTVGLSEPMTFESGLEAERASIAKNWGRTSETESVTGGRIQGRKGSL